MRVVLLPQAKLDLEFWKKTNNKSVLLKITKLVDSIVESPYQGIGKPEALKHNLSGKWSRRIDKANRFIYFIEGNELNVYSLKGHYQ